MKIHPGNVIVSMMKNLDCLLGFFVFLIAIIDSYCRDTKGCTEVAQMVKGLHEVHWSHSGSQKPWDEK